jgi:hypothetical protein
MNKRRKCFVCFQTIDKIEHKLPNEQYGFRRGSRTGNAVIEAEYMILEAMEI